MSEKQINTFVHVVDYLAASAAQTPNYGPVAMITLRDDPATGKHVDELEAGATPGSFEPKNLALTVEQARRLRNDLNFLFAEIPCFQQAEEEATEVQPKRRRRRGRKKKDE